LVASDDDWRAWWERERMQLPARLAALLDGLDPGPNAMWWMLGAQRPASPAAAAVADWLTPPGAQWAFVAAAHPEVVGLLTGTLLGFAAPDEHNPVALADVASAWADGVPAVRAFVAERIAEGTDEDVEEARRCLLAGMPPHWPPDRAPMPRGASVRALRALQAEGRVGLEALCVKAMEATAIAIRWRRLERVMEGGARDGAW
jgi:hypothetical protein